MLLPCSQIILGSGFQWDFVTETETTSTWKQFTDTTIVKMPRKVLHVLKAGKLELAAKRGDTIVIKHGYNGELKEVFNGYISFVKPTVPVELMGEDEMFMLKQRSVTPASFPTVNVSDPELTESSVSVADILKHIGITNYSLLGDISFLGSFEIGADIKNAAQVLEKLKTTLSMPSFFREGVLVIGKQYDPARAKKVQFEFGWNIISHSLEYRRKDEIKLKVKATSHLTDGSKLEVTVGDSDGEERTLNFYNLTTEELKAAATNEMEQLKYDGYRGKFTAFGEPFVRHGDIVELSDPEEQEKDGKYFVDKVVYKCGCRDTGRR
jgi:hypothetical protein